MIEMPPLRTADLVYRVPLAFPALADPPVPSGFWAWIGPRSHRAFLYLNRVMAPLLGAGLGQWMGTPVGGYLLLLETVGRRSGRIRRVPLTYLILDGAAWVMAGYGVRTEWYRNLLARPEVVVHLPGRLVTCRAEEVLDPAVRARVMPRLARAAGLPGLLVGCNPWTASDARIVGLLDWIPLVRLAPLSGPLNAGSDDPGGRAWLWRQAFVLAVVFLTVSGIGRALRAVRSGSSILEP
jgi:deazaflavin-dependent oxidoreductase (nitroreductase family)